MALVQQTSHLLLSEGTTLALAPLAQSLADPLFFFFAFSPVLFSVISTLSSCFDWVFPLSVRPLFHPLPYMPLNAISRSE